MRHEAIIWTNEASNNGKLISKHTTTNMLYLSRYRKHLHSQQRLEIRGGVLMADDLSYENSGSCDVKSNREDVHIKDYLPILRDICNKLEKAKGKVCHTLEIFWVSQFCEQHDTNLLITCFTFPGSYYLKY